MGELETVDFTHRYGCAAFVFIRTQGGNCARRETADWFVKLIVLD